MKAPETITAEWTPTQEDFDLFAAISGDDNPIHVDAAFSARTRFGRTVSHGMLLYSRVWALIRNAWPENAHALQNLMFPNPAYAGEALAIRIEPAGGKLAVTVSRKDDGATVLQGECAFRRAGE